MEKLFEVSRAIKSENNPTIQIIMAMSPSIVRAIPSLTRNEKYTSECPNTR
jgi:hypothetical protein